MNCSDFRSAVFDPPDDPSWEAHAEECASCRDFIAAQPFFDQRHRAQLIESAPPRLKAEILDRCIEKRQRRRWRMPAIATAVFLCVALAATALFFSSHTRMAEALVHDHLEYAAKPNPSEFTTANPDTLSQWFTGRLPFQVDVPRLTDAQLLGGRRCRIDHHWAGLVLYESGTRRISVFVLPDDVKFDKLPLAHTQDGVNLLVVNGRGVRYAIVGGVSPQQIRSWASALPRT